ncbi:uncharacterized protein LOC135941183 [Cloeon dipterum]|uniref:uncharacterized protein LOC135941183 n=1 Tax=Cloeon dipterum TaxID=197152 RepID=UPI0032200548
MLVEDSPYCSQGQTTWGRPCASKSGRCRFPRGMDTTRGRKDLALLRLSSRPSKCRPQWRRNAKQDTWTVPIFVRSRKEGLGLVEVEQQAQQMSSAVAFKCKTGHLDGADFCAVEEGRVRPC